MESSSCSCTSRICVDIHRLQGRSAPRGSDRLAVHELSHRRPPAANRATLRRAPAAPTVPFRPCARGAPAITLHDRDSRTNALPRLDNSQMLRYAGLFTWGAVGLWLLIFVIDSRSVVPEEAHGVAPI